MTRRRDERGAIAVLVGVLVFVLVGILAFVADFGYAYANQRKLQNAVDAAVLARVSASSPAPRTRAGAAST